MDESEGNMSTEEVRSVDSSSVVKKPKKRSLVERELETNMTARITSPVTDALSTSRYGRARRLKSDYEITKTEKSNKTDVTSVIPQSPVYKMHASNSPCKKEMNESYLDNQIDNIYQENISLSRFSNESSPSPAKKFPKVYTRKDLIQNREAEETIMLIKNLFSPAKGSKTPKMSADLSTFESSETKAKQNGHIDNASVVKTLDFDGKKKGQRNDQKVAIVSKNDLFELEAKCPYQVGDVAWARMGTFPFWPCIVTREPSTELFVKKKMFGRVERDIIHVTFLGDNGRRSWIVDNMLQHYAGVQHFMDTREKFTAEDKKKDPKLYAAYFVSEKKQSFWNNSVEEAETLMREPKRLRIDVLNDMLWKSQTAKKPKSGKISRTDSDVSLSESLYDSLFSEDDKSDDPEKSKIKSRNKSFDVSDVVTACLDNMAAKTGITKIQKQSHMDRWLQKAKSKTPEKISKLPVLQKVEGKSSSKSKKKSSPKAPQNTMRLRRSNDSLPSLWNTKNSSEDESSNNRAKEVKIENNDVTNGYPTDDSHKAAVIVIDDDSSHSVEKKNDEKSEKEPELEINKKDSKDEVNVELKDTKIDNEMNNTVENMDQDYSMNSMNETKQETQPVSDSSEKDLNKTVEKMDQDSSLNDAIATNGNTHPKPDDSVQNGQEMNCNVEPNQNSLRVNEKAEEITANDENMKADSEKVSKESMEAIVKLPNINEASMKVEQNKPGMKDLNDFINEASVTESKNTINIQAGEDTQGTSKPEKQHNKTHSDIDFLDTSKNTETTADKYYSKYTNHDKNNLKEVSHSKSTKDDDKLIKQDLNTNINTDDANTKSSFDVNYLGNASKDLTENELLNKSCNSESILEYDNNEDDPENASIKSNKSISTLKDDHKVCGLDDNELNKSPMSVYLSDTEIQILTKLTKTDNQSKEENGSTVRTYVESPTFTQDLDGEITDAESEKVDTNTNIANSDKVDDKPKLEDRTYAESPTFTQLLESDEFFRDVNEECNDKNKSQNLSNEVIEKLINEPDCNEPMEQKLLNNLIHKARESKTDIKKYKDKQDTFKNSKLKAETQLDSKLIDKKDDAHIPNKNNDKHEPFSNVVEKARLTSHISSQNKDNPNKQHIPDENDKIIDKVAYNNEDVYENGEDEDDEEESDDPSPEYESLDEDITEDFRKHMQSIENNIKDKKDEEQIVKICNEIAEKAKLSPTKYVDFTYENKNAELTYTKKEEVLKKDSNESKVVKVINKKIVNEIQRNLTEKVEPSSENNSFKDLADKDINEKRKNTIKMNGNATEKELMKDAMKTRPRLSLKINRSPKEEAKKQERQPKVMISPLKLDTNLKITNKSLIDVQKTSKSRKKLSLNRSPKPEKIENQSVINIQENVEVKPDIKEINSHLEEVNKNTQEPIMNGCHNDIDTKLNDIVDTVSIHSEDSDASVQEVPRRILRSKPEITLEYALKSPEFMKYLELRQDYLMDEHPELNDQEILSYVYKTWQYELNSDCKNEDSHFVKVIRDTPRKRPKTKNRIDDHFSNKNDKCSKVIDFESKDVGPISNDVKQEPEIESQDISSVKVKNNIDSEESDIVKTSVDNVVKSPEASKQIKRSKSKRDRKRKSDTKDLNDSIVKNDKNKIDNQENKKLTTENLKSPISIDITDADVVLVKDKYKNLETVSIKSEESARKSLRSRTSTTKIIVLDPRTEKIVKEEDTESIDSDNSEINLRQLRSKVLKDKIQDKSEDSAEISNAPVKEEIDDGGSTLSDNEPLLRRKKKVEKNTAKSLEDPEFIKYIELRQDAIMDENPDLTESEIVQYLHKTWLYEESCKSDIKKNDELEQANLIKGCNEAFNEPKKSKRRPKPERSTGDPVREPKVENNIEETITRDKPRRKTIQPLYNEEFYSDVEEELEVFEIFKHKKTPITVVSKNEEKSPKNSSKLDKDLEIVETKPAIVKETHAVRNEQAILDEIELYFTELAKPKPSVFKGLIRERVCDICEREGSLIKCKSCHGMFHTDCVKKQQQEIIEIESLPLRGRKKKKKLGRKPKSLDSEHSDDKSQDASTESIEEIPDVAFDAETFESQLEDKMRKMLENVETHYDSYSSDDGIDWEGTVAGKCEIVDVKLKKRTPPLDFSDFRCNNCLRHEVPLCFVCKSAISKTEKKMRQKCVAAQCNKYYHLECLDHWPQTQFNSGECSKNKKVNEFSETLTCPRHVCHTCVSDDPRGCKTRFSADKLAKCVRCPATYHSFNKCLPAGTQVLTASQIICPRHINREHKLGKVSSHVNTGWCFICAEGGSLICCEYCPTSFHAECLNIKPPEGNYMCEDCETGRLPLYGEMVWVKLGHYRWWPGIILHPSEIPENLFLMKHGIGEFVVRFFGQYDHYWVNRGRVFPYQEGDSGRISSQKSKIDAAFTTAIEHAQRAYEILKNADTSNDEESLDIASSLLPPHYVKLKSNKPSGSLCGRRVEDPSLSLTACDCDPTERDPCGPHSHCLNRMLLTECGPTCRTGDRCNNRAFEKRLYPKLVPYRTPHRGWGLKTLEDIKAGQFVIEYVGELIDEEEFRRRMRRKHEIRDENYYFLTLDKERMIDAGPKGNLARFMNHCCEPNCETQKWTVLGDIRVGLFAINDIPANTEVTFNYNLDCDGIEKKRCLCGAKRCSGYIGAKLKQDESQSKKGKNGKVKRPYNKKKKVEDSPSTKTKPKRPLGRPPKPKELTEIEKDLLIIKNASNEISSDESSKKSVENQKSLKRKRSTDDALSEPSVKKVKCEVGD